MLHFRYEKEIPPPHFRVHSIYGPHCPQWPSIGFSLRFFTHCPLMHHWIKNKVKIATLASKTSHHILRCSKNIETKQIRASNCCRGSSFPHKCCEVVLCGRQGFPSAPVNLPANNLAPRISALLPIGRKKKLETTSTQRVMQSSFCVTKRHDEHLGKLFLELYLTTIFV